MSMSMRGIRSVSAHMWMLPLLLLVAGIAPVRAHEHHEATEIDTTVPFDSIIYVHAFVWGISFPLGMVLGLSKSRFHVPLQSLNVVLTFIGAFLGHHHHGRMFPATVHGTMAKILSAAVIVQATLGIFLKLHIMEKTLRRWILPVHSVLGKAFPLLGWTQMLFGVATALSFCRDGNLGQCLAHYIMGSAFIAYAAILVIMLNVGGKWLERTGFSQEMLDSTVIMIWGIINTFTEHRGSVWSTKDMQHVMMGVLWWTGGLLGMFLSRKGKRSFVPAVIIVMTGWAMSAHEQHLMISTKIHGLFGYALIAAGALRIVEICFVLNDGPTPHGVVRVFQHLPPYLLVLGGTIFISATDEEMHNAADLEIDHVSYALFDFSLSFLIYLVITALVHLYSNTGKNSNATSDQSGDSAEAGYTKLDGPGHGRSHADGGGEGDHRGADSYELDSGIGSAEEDEDAMKIGVGDEIDWLDEGETAEGKDERQAGRQGVRL